ncbi:MAG: protein translocase subunit SecDF, partial [Bacteroidota bacterium]
GPELSSQAQENGLFAVLLALLLIVLFMILYYGVAGLIASLALIANAIIMLGALAQIKAALSLPGIGGIIISLGAGIDGTVIILEVIKSNLRKGLSLRKAFSDGYTTSYGSIIDANLTTLAASIVLYLWGQGAVKGFATTLTIGTISSFFTSVLVNRVITEGFIRAFGINKLSFSLFKKI